MIKRKEKKAELTSKQLITIIILIVSFAIILIFLFLLGFKAIIGEQSCKQSLTLRGIKFFGKLVIEPKCEAKDVCINLGGECEVKGENVLNNKVKDLNEIYSVTENLIKDCWEITGKGEVDYGRNGACGICYVIYFDDKIQEDKPGLVFKKIEGITTEEKIFQSKNYLAVIALNGDFQGSYTRIVLAQYPDELKNAGCKSILFS